MMTIGEERLANGVLAQLRRIADQVEKIGVHADRWHRAVQCACEHCGNEFAADERAFVTVCPSCDNPTRVCANCHAWDADADCAKCPYRRED